MNSLKLILSYKGWKVYLGEETGHGTIPIILEDGRHVADLWQDTEGLWCCAGVDDMGTEKSYKTPKEAVRRAVKELLDTEIDYKGEMDND